jgi:hypothetical protein
VQWAPKGGEWHGQECTAGRRAYPGSARVVREAYMIHLFAVQLRRQQRAENFLNTSNHFHALEMATFNPISYTYVLTAPRSKIVAARRKPALKQSSILGKNQRTKPSGAALGRHLLILIESLCYTTLCKHEFSYSVFAPFFLSLMFKNKELVEDIGSRKLTIVLTIKPSLCPRHYSHRQTNR